MLQSVEVIKKWVQVISDDYMHYSDEDKVYIESIAKYMEWESLPNEEGCIGYLISKDFDCKKKLSVVLLYCKPEYRCIKNLIYMFRRFEEIAKQEGCVSILFSGGSISGYKENKFNNIIEHFGYKCSGFIKEIQQC